MHILKLVESVYLYGISWLVRQSVGLLKFGKNHGLRLFSILEAG